MEGNQIYKINEELEIKTRDMYEIRVGEVVLMLSLHEVEALERELHKITVKAVPKEMNPEILKEILNR